MNKSFCFRKRIDDNFVNDKKHCLPNIKEDLKKRQQTIQFNYNFDSVVNKVDPDIIHSSYADFSPKKKQFQSYCEKISQNKLMLNFLSLSSIINELFQLWSTREIGSVLKTTTVG